MRVTELLVWGALVHLVVDWLLQNRWLAEHKHKLSHPAAWLHAGMHGAALLLVFPPIAAVLLGVSHLLIDTRLPLQHWQRLVSASGDPNLDKSRFDSEPVR